MMYLRRVLKKLCGVALALGSLSASAQDLGHDLQPRLNSRLAESPRAVLAHSRSPRVRNAQDLGAAPSEMPLSGMTLVFRRTPAQQAALDELLLQQQTPGSPAYRHWLTPETFASRFGVADADILTTENWLETYGFHIDNVSRSRDRINFSGTAGQVQRAFGTQLHRYQVEGAIHLASTSDLTLPAQLASMTAAVLHLSDFRPKPAWKLTPHLTDATTGAHYFLPTDIAVMYDFPSLTSGAFGSLVPTVPIAVVGQSYVNTGFPSAIETFSTYASVNYNPVLPILVPGSGPEAISYGDEGESEIDLEYIRTGNGFTGSPFFVFVGDSPNYSVFDALAFAITDNIAPVLSISYGACEPLLSTTELDQWNALFQQAAAQGQTIVASSGDSGSTGCAPESNTPGITPAIQQSVAVNFPASSPYVTAVGGTQLASGTFAVGNTQYWSPYLSQSASLETLLSYAPEVVWNEGSADNGIVAGGGGSSSYFPRPAWQTNFPNMPQGNYRLVPDIALQSSISSPGFVFCTTDPNLLAQEGQTSSCANGLIGSNQKFTLAGGTSFAAPIFAGMVALLNAAQKANGLGNLNPQLYQLASVPATYASAFHDITSGTIACVAGATNCIAATQADYPAQTGYDEATGLGSIDVSALLAAWPAGTTASLLPTATGIVVPTGATTTAGETLPLQINVGTIYIGPIQPIPTGTVSVAIDGAAVPPPLTLAPTSDPASDQSVAPYNLVISSTPGYHLVTATYSGDALHAPSSGTYSFVVGSVEASGTFTLAAPGLTIAANGTGTTTVTVTPAGGYDGELTWTLGITGGPTTPLNGCYKIQPTVVNNITTANLSLGVGTACQSASPSYRGQFKAVGAQQSTASPVQQRGLPAEAAYAVLLLCGCVARGRRTWRSLFLLIVLVLGAMAAGPMGCGGGSGSGSAATTPTPPASTSTPTASTYTMTLTGTDSVNGAITSSTAFKLTVN
jgi:subtilase family serine protease